MEKLSSAILVALLLIAGAALAGCTSTAPALTAQPVTATTAVPETQVSFLYVQEAHNGTFVSTGNNTYLLTLSRVIPYTIYFSDRPARVAGLIPNEEFIAGFDWSVAPNAAISIPGGRKTEDTLLVVLSHPQYNASAQLLTYHTTILANYRGDKLRELNADADPTIPAKFGRVTLFIDSGSVGPGYQATQKNGMVRNS